MTSEERKAEAKRLGFDDKNGLEKLHICFRKRRKKPVFA